MIEFSSKFLTLITLYNFFWIYVLIIPSDLINLFFYPTFALLLPYSAFMLSECAHRVRSPHAPGVVADKVLRV